MIEAPLPSADAGVSAVICASSICGPVNTTVRGAAPTNSLALTSPAAAATDALKVTSGVFDTPWFAGEMRLTVGAGVCACVAVSSRSKLMSVLVGDCWCSSTASTLVPATSSDGSMAACCHALSSAPPIAVVALVV